MSFVASEPDRKNLWPWLATAVTVVAAALQLHYQGRLWMCSCGQLLLWVGEARSANTSQHLFDPYSFTHLLHGFVFCWLIAWCAPRLSWAWQLWAAVAAEAVWEVVENSEFVIQRYREARALGYFGDKVVNSVGDIVMCGFGFVLAKHLGFRRLLVMFVAVEVVLLFSIRDSLILNVLMLIYPAEWIEQWQAGL